MSRYGSVGEGALHDEGPLPYSWSGPPGTGPEDLRYAFRQLGEGDEKAGDRQTEIAAGGTVRGGSDEPNEGDHVGQGKELGDRKGQIELAWDIGNEVIYQVDRRERGEGNGADDGRPVPLR